MARRKSLGGKPKDGADAMPSSEIIRSVRTCIEWAALIIEILGALVIVAGVLKVAITRGTVRYLFQLDKPGAYESYKHQMGRSLLLGLEFLVAGDVVRTAGSAGRPRRWASICKPSLTATSPWSSTTSTVCTPTAAAFGS
jgi:uncharacterized membrane protein